MAYVSSLIVKRNPRSTLAYNKRIEKLVFPIMATLEVKYRNRDHVVPSDDFTICSSVIIVTAH